MKICQLDTKDNIWRRAVVVLKKAAMALFVLAGFAGFAGAIIWIDPDPMERDAVLLSAGVIATMFSVVILAVIYCIAHWIFCVDDRSIQEKCPHEWQGTGAFVVCKICRLDGAAPVAKKGGA
ncbi:hypothetical protein LCGC14_1346830 [marine sediment metagenome]|uniref:Uncharacterized protein n=1 Tax=marine sediment metagenome TaxID=412755 RepID=A0A0F9KC51_9ZZZZ